MIEPIRLLAFAFAGADLLFEIDRDGGILFATGATSGFSSSSNLAGQPAAELLPPSDRISCTLVKPGNRSSLGDGGTDAETGLADRRTFLSAAEQSSGGKGAIALVSVPNL